MNRWFASGLIVLGALGLVAAVGYAVRCASAIPSEIVEGVLLFVSLNVAGMWIYSDLGN